MKWDYKVIKSSYTMLLVQDTLNLMGKGGWELVSVVHDRLDNLYTMFFKRPTQPEHLSEKQIA